ncbi:unnamed protein product [Allacma fusca]|uniref:Uncharacterized protein n=1 Tax=Allacma fusca TaxID=39272 RepID=A0A8J2K695_9HEXA|nr:unnamed protein product [Allacma fusca]
MFSSRNQSHTMSAVRPASTLGAMSSKHSRNETRKTRKGSSNSSTLQKRLSEGCRWTYNRIKNYGQLDFPDATDHLFLLKLKIDSAELLQYDYQKNGLNNPNNEWRIKVDAFGTDLKSQTFKFDSEGKYSPKRKQGILIRIRSDLVKFSNFLSENTLRIKVESIYNEGLVHTGEILIKLSQFMETLITGVADKWRRISRDIKLDDTMEKGINPELKLSVLLSLCNEGQCFNSEDDDSPPDCTGGSIESTNLSSDNNGSKVSLQSSKENVPVARSAASSIQEEVSASPNRNRILMSQTLNASRTRPRRKQKNPRISVGRLTLLSNDLEDRKREIESLKELHEKEMSALTTEHLQVCNELEILKTKIPTDENKNNIQNENFQKIDVGIQTETEPVALNYLNNKEEKSIGDNRRKIDDAQLSVKETILDNLIEEYNAKLSSLNIRTEALKIRDTRNVTRFGNSVKTHRERIAKKQEIKRLIESTNILDVIKLELCDALKLDIRFLEAQSSEFKDDLLRKKLEKEIQNKKDLLATVQN